MVDGIPPSSMYPRLNIHALPQLAIILLRFIRLIFLRWKIFFHPEQNFGDSAFLNRYLEILLVDDRGMLLQTFESTIYV